MAPFSFIALLIGMCPKEELQIEKKNSMKLFCT